MHGLQVVAALYPLMAGVLATCALPHDASPDTGDLAKKLSQPYPKPTNPEWGYGPDHICGPATYHTTERVWDHYFCAYEPDLYAKGPCHNDYNTFIDKIAWIVGGICHVDTTNQVENGVWICA